MSVQVLCATQALSDYLGQPRPLLQARCQRRLQEALGVSDAELELCTAHADSGQWTKEALGHAVDLCVAESDPDACDHNVLGFFTSVYAPERLHDQGGAEGAAMATRLRVPDESGAQPSLAYRCELCEAEGIDEMWKLMHIDFVHGGVPRYRNAVAVLRRYAAPHSPSGTAKRLALENARRCQEFGMRRPETLLPMSAYAKWDNLAADLHHGLADVAWTARRAIWKVLRHGRTSCRTPADKASEELFATTAARMDPRASPVSCMCVLRAALLVRRAPATFPGGPGLLHAVSTPGGTAPEH